MADIRDIYRLLEPILPSTLVHFLPVSYLLNRIHWNKQRGYTNARLVPSPRHRTFGPFPFLTATRTVTASSARIHKEGSCIRKIRGTQHPLFIQPLSALLTVDLAHLDSLGVDLHSCASEHTTSPQILHLRTHCLPPVRKSGDIVVHLYSANNTRAKFCYLSLLNLRSTTSNKTDQHDKSAFARGQPKLVSVHFPAVVPGAVRTRSTYRYISRRPLLADGQEIT